MNAKKYLVVITLAAAVSLPMVSSAQILYSQDFNSATLGLTGPTAFGGFGQINNVGGTGWQVQGGGGGGGISVTTGIDTGGVGGSQGFLENWDHSLATGFTFNQTTIYGAIAAPGAGFTLSQILFEMDIFVSGSADTTPLGITLQNSTNSFSFTPTLANDAYTHIVFTGNQATPGGGNGSAYNPNLASNLRIEFGAGDGFGFDAGNIVRLDNIVVSVPEPASFALMGIGAAGLVMLRRRT